MMGRGHMGTGIAAASFLPYADLPLFAASILGAGIIAGSVFPDRVETLGGIRILPHRGLSHWLLGWVLVLIGLTLYLQKNPGTLPVLGLIGLSIGSIIHILGDMPNYQKIPLLTPSPSFSLGWWKSGQNDALIVVALFLPHLYFLHLV